MDNGIIEVEKYNSDFNSLKWVSKAISKDTDREVIMRINIKGDVCAGSDGRRLHIAKMSADYTDGMYKIIKSTKKLFMAHKVDTGDIYPNYIQVIPKWNDLKEIVVQDTEEMTGADAFDIAIEFHNLNQSKFNLDFLIDSVSGNVKHVSQADIDSPVRMQDTVEKEMWTRLAVVMPMRITS